MFYNKEEIISLMDKKGWIARTNINNKFYYMCGYTKSNEDEVLKLKASLEKFGIRSSNPKLKTNRKTVWELKIKLGDYLKNGFYFNNNRKKERFNLYKHDFGNLQRLDGPNLYERRTLNRRFFKKWSREMAYVLGFLTADGWLARTNVGGYQIGFSSKDKEQLELINKLLKSNSNIKRKIKDENIWYEIRIGSKKMYNDLENYGLYPNKSLSILLPKIPYKYVWDYIRGYFDGDGCIYLNYNRNTIEPSIILTCGSKNFLLSLNKILNFNFRKRKNNLYELRTYKKSNIKEFFNKAYDNTDIYLNRKYQKFVEYLKIKI